MNLTELASAIAALTPSDRDAVFRMVYAQPSAQPSAPLGDPHEPCVVMLASRAAVFSHGGGNVINVIKSIREGTGLGLGDAKVAFENGCLPGTMTREEATALADRINTAWSAYLRGDPNWFPATVVAAK